MSSTQHGRSELRLLSIVEALTVTGPLKPLLMFSTLARAGVAHHPRLAHTLMTTRRNGQIARENDELYNAAVEAGLDYIAIPEKRAFDPGVLTQMAETIRALRPAIIETHDCKSHFLLALLRGRHRDLRLPKWIAFHHGYTRTSWKILLYQQLDRLTLPRTDRVVTLCQPFANMLADRGVDRARISIISNAVAPRPVPTAEAVAQARASLGIAPAECVILSVGRLSVEKGQADLIQAFERVLRSSDNQLLRLVLVGEGPERERLGRLAASLGDKVLFAGHVRDPSSLFHAADIFVLPSHSEGSPLVILEAMAAALPIVATSVGGVPETLQNGATALLTPPRQPDALATAITSLVRQQSLRRQLGSAALEALTEFSPASYAAKLLTIYERVLQAN